jgi:hypothetical protein
VQDQRALQCIARLEHGRREERREIGDFELARARFKVLSAASVRARGTRTRAPVSPVQRATALCPVARADSTPSAAPSPAARRAAQHDFRHAPIAVTHTCTHQQFVVVSAMSEVFAKVFCHTTHAHTLTPRTHCQLRIRSPPRNSKLLRLNEALQHHLHTNTTSHNITRTCAKNHSL